MEGFFFFFFGTRHGGYRAGGTELSGWAQNAVAKGSKGGGGSGYLVLDRL